VVLDHVGVVDAYGSRPDRAVLLLDDRIYAESAAGREWPEDATVLDGTGRFVIPGLVDSHVHLAYGGATVWVGDTLDGDLRATLYAGVTEVVDLGGPTSLFDIRDRLLVPLRIHAAGPFLTAVGSHPCETWPDDGLCTFVTAEDAGSVASARMAEGADVLKVALADASFTPWGATPRLDLDALDAIVGAGAPVYAHVDEDEDVIDGANAGVSVLAHPAFAAEMGDEALAAAATVSAVHSTVAAFRGVVDLVDGVTDPTDPDLALDPAVAANWVYVQAHPEVLLEGWADESRGWTQHVRANLAALRAAGAVVVPGSDAGYYFVPHGAALRGELAELVDAGWTPLEALTAATLTAREVLGVEGGLVQAGEPADLVVLAGDPAEDLGALAAVEAVVLGGRVLSREEILTVDLLDPGGTACLDAADCDGACDGVAHACVDACAPPYATAGQCDEASWCMPADGVATTEEGACHAEEPCDLYAQDCEPAAYGQACVPYDVDTNACWYGGTRQVGQSCTWESEEDACEPGLFCSWITYRCYELCDPDRADTCSAGRCTRQVAEDGSPWFGLCL
jgi:imidazolonepropionase-like amidohydrolase